MSPHLATLLLLLAGLVDESSAVNLAEFRWSFDAESNSTSLTICSAEPLFEQGNVSSVVLVVQVSDTSSTDNIAGALVDDYCAAFIMSRFVQLPRNVTFYQLVIAVSVNGGQEFVSSVAIFAMEVQTATLPCSGKALTRAFAPPSTTFENCLNDNSLLVNVCYTEGDLTSSALCFIIEDSNPSGVRVCLEGSSPTPPVTDDDFISINFLAYSSSSTGAATVALQVTGAEPSAEAVFWKDGVVQSVSKFSDCPWNATSFAPHFAEYAVCVVATDMNNQPVASSAATVTDLAVRVAHSTSHEVEDALLQFSFINANPSSTYRATVWPSLPSTRAPLDADPLDCTDVDHNSTCFTFMDYSGAEKNVFVAIEYANQAEGAEVNMVVVPYNITLLNN